MPSEGRASLHQPAPPLDGSESLIKFSGRFTTLFKPCEAFVGATFVFREKRHHLIVWESELGQRCEASLNIVAPRMRSLMTARPPYGRWGAFNMSGTNKTSGGLFAGCGGLRPDSPRL